MVFDVDVDDDNALETRRVIADCPRRVRGTLTQIGKDGGGGGGVTCILAAWISQVLGTLYHI